MKFIDITLPLSNDLPVWPGDPEIQITWLSQIKDGDEANVSQLNFGAHTGTHIDAPLHFIDGGDTVDQLDLSVLIGEVDVIKVPDHISVIDKKYLQTLGNEISQRVLFKTRNSTAWESTDKSFHSHYTAVESSGAQWLVEHGVKLVGIDYLSISPFGDEVKPHQILLAAGIIIIENLNLREAGPGKYRLICLPMNISGREGAPARAVLEVL